VKKASPEITAGPYC